MTEYTRPFLIRRWITFVGIVLGCGGGSLAALFPEISSQPSKFQPRALPGRDHPPGPHRTNMPRT